MNPIELDLWEWRKTLSRCEASKIGVAVIDLVALRKNWELRFADREKERAKQASEPFLPVPKGA